MVVPCGHASVREHVLQVPARSGWNRPVSHNVHFSPAPACLPAGHGTEAVAPVGQTRPNSQVLHVTARGSSWYRPASHLAHTWSAASACVPARQQVGAVALSGQMQPLGHGSFFVGSLQNHPTSHVLAFVEPCHGQATRCAVRVLSVCATILGTPYNAQQSSSSKSPPIPRQLDRPQGRNRRPCTRAL